MTEHVKLDAILSRPADKRLAIAEAIWASLVASGTALPAPDWHRDIVHDRLAEDEAVPDDTEDWRALRQRIESGA